MLLHINYAKKYYSMLIQSLLFMLISCSGLGYWTGLIVGMSLAPAEEGISHYILFAVLNASVAILSIYAIMLWAKFMLDRYMR